MKRIFALSLALLLALSLTACGEDTVESVIEDARDFIEDIDSVHCTVLTSIDMTEGEDTLTNYMKVSADMDLENQIYFMNLASTNNENENILMDIYITMGDSINYYMKSNNKWMKMTNVDSEALSGLDLSTDVRRDFDAFFTALSESENTTMVQDDIEDIPLYRLQAPVKIKSLEMAKDFSLDTFITGMLGETATQDMVNAFISELGEVDLIVYINRETYEPYGYMLDLKPALDTLYSNIGEEDITVNEACTYSIYTDYDEIEELTVPDAAKRAPDISSMSNQ